MKYDLTFFEGIDCVLSGESWIQGEDFADGVVIATSSINGFASKQNNAHLIVKDFSSECLNSWVPEITFSLRNQKYRKVYNTDDAMRKIKKYDISFSEVVALILKYGNMAQGENFEKGVVLTIDDIGGYIIKKNFNKPGVLGIEALCVTKEFYKQKYRIVESQEDAMK